MTLAFNDGFDCNILMVFGGGGRMWAAVIHGTLAAHIVYIGVTIKCMIPLEALQTAMHCIALELDRA